MTDAAVVTVARYEWRMDAILARCRLESCGIQANLADDCMSGIYWHYAKVLGGFRLQVASGDADDARAILAEPPQPGGDPILTESEQKTDRLLRAAALGVLSLPVMLYALWLLLNVVLLDGPWNQRERRQIIAASVFIVPAAVVLAILTSLWAGALVS
ncbi:MAG TPA: hypothetical protein VMU19_14295 [Bryobacteraceae bacterium]|nr:hypothetical protein [Bryobacteraceae bacterium]